MSLKLVPGWHTVLLGNLGSSQIAEVGR